MDIVNALTQVNRDIRGLLDRLRDDHADAEALLTRLAARLVARDLAQRVHLDPELLAADPTMAATVRELSSVADGARLVLVEAVPTVGTSEFPAARSMLIDTVVEQMTGVETYLLPAVKRLIPSARRRQLGKLFELRRLAELEAHGTGQGVAAPPGR